MRRALITTALMLFALVAFAPSGAIAKPGRRGVQDRARRQPRQARKERPSRSSRSATGSPSPHRQLRAGEKARQAQLRKWICGWRAAGLYPGQVPYACAGKARWKRKSDIWIVDKCENQRQPRGPAARLAESAAGLRLQRQLDLSVDPALNMLQDSGANVARTSLSWRGVEGDQGTVQLVRLRRSSTSTCSTAASARYGC